MIQFPPGEKRQAASQALVILAVASFMGVAVFYFSQQREELARIVGGWSDAADKKSDEAAAVPSASSAPLDYDPAMVVGGQTLYEDSARKPASPDEIVGVLAKGSTEAARLVVPLYGPGVPAYSIPEAGLSNPPVVSPQMQGAGGPAEQGSRVSDFAAYAPSVDMPKMTQNPPPLPPGRRRAPLKESEVSRQDKQDLRTAISEDTDASQSMASGYLSSKSVEDSRGRHEVNAAKSGNVFDGSAGVGGRIKSVFDLSSLGDPDQLVVSPPGTEDAGGIAAACAAARASDGHQVLLLGDEMGRTARGLNALSSPGCCDYLALQRWNESLRALSQQCSAFNNAAARLAVACKTPYYPADCGAFPAPRERSSVRTCLAPLSLGLALLAGGALLPMLGPAYVVLGGGLAGGALLGGLPGLLLCALGIAGALLLQGSSEKSRI